MPTPISITELIIESELFLSPKDGLFLSPKDNHDGSSFDAMISTANDATLPAHSASNILAAQATAAAAILAKFMEPSPPSLLPQMPATVQKRNPKMKFKDQGIRANGLPPVESRTCWR